jgi:hypothetical protein
LIACILIINYRFWAALISLEFIAELTFSHR